MADRTLRARRADNRARLTRSDLLRYFFGPSCGASLCDAGAGREVELHHGVQPSNRRLGALILVDAVRAESVAASAGHVIGDGLLEVVAAQKPLEAAAGIFEPALLAGHLMDFEEGIDHVLRFGLSLEREWPLGE